MYILTGGDQVGLQLDDILDAAAFQPQKYECGPNTSPSGVTHLFSKLSLIWKLKVFKKASAQLKI